MFLVFLLIGYEALDIDSKTPKQISAHSTLL